MSKTNLEFALDQTRRLEARGIALLASTATYGGELMIKGQVFQIRTLHDLVLMIVRLRYERGLSDNIRAHIMKAGREHGLIDTDGSVTPLYFALMSDEAEKLARDLTGHNEQATGLCACGCGRMVRGKAKTATQSCRKRLSRIVA